MSDIRRVGFSSVFIRRADRLSKRYRHIHEDVDDFTEGLKRGETPGDRLQGTGDYIAYKARIASSDIQRGKSGGFRVVYYLRTETHTLLLTIYAKTEQEDIASAEVLELIEVTLDELEAPDSDTDASTMPDPDTPPAE